MKKGQGDLKAMLSGNNNRLQNIKDALNNLIVIREQKKDEIEIYVK
jgi:hypothetical protein